MKGNTKMKYTKVLQAIKDGKIVKWGNDLYDVVYDKVCDRYLVICNANDYTTVFNKQEAKECYIHA